MLIKNVKKLYHEFPSNFWTLTGATFIDRLGGALIFPFLALYVTQKFSVSMTEVGKLFAIWAIGNLFGTSLGGAMADKFGRRSMFIFGLVASAISSLFMGLVNDLHLFYILAGFVGLLADSGWPAQAAMVADLLPENKHTQGYGILRIAVNLAAAIGPAVGGLLASRSYLVLFIADAISSTITAVIVFTALPETKPEIPDDEPGKSLIQTFSGYIDVFKDSMYMVFMIASMLSVFVYIQMNSSLPVYLRDIYGITPQQFGSILSLNAVMVVLFQFWMTRQIAGFPQLIMIALGTAIYALGFSMYGFVSNYPLFLLAMVIITIGEMIIAPISQALTAKFAPEEMRGRYMAVFGLSELIPIALGPLAAGLIMDNYDPNWVWYAAGIVSLMAVAVYLWLHMQTRKRFVLSTVTSNPHAALDSK